MKARFFPCCSTAFEVRRTGHRADCRPARVCTEGACSTATDSTASSEASIGVPADALADLIHTI
jgi:hypothetical protein